MCIHTYIHTYINKEKINSHCVLHNDKMQLKFSVNILAEETQDCQLFGNAIHHSANDDFAQSLLIIIDDETWYSCKVCGKRFHQWNMFKIHCTLHFAGLKVSKHEDFSASDMLEEGKCDVELFHSSSDGLEMNETSEHAVSCSYTDDCKFEDLTTIKLDAADVVEDLEHEGKTSDSNVDFVDKKKTEVYYEETNNTDGEKFEASQNKGSYQCMLCYCCFEGGGQLKNHLRKHNRSKPFKCSVCNRTFNRSNNLKNHVKKHNAKQPFACSQCDFQFLNITELCEHLKLHPSPFGCSLCHKSYGRFDHLCHHVKVIHSSKRPYKCNYCGQTFKQRHHMTEHKFIHTAAEGRRDKRKRHRPKCKICSRVFRTRDRRQRHMLVTHNVGSWHECTVCHQKYLYPAYLKEHMRTHENQKPYECSECPRRFNSRSGLRTHLVWHSGERNFSCEVCGRTFYRRSHALSHFQVHLRQ